MTHVRTDIPSQKRRKRYFLPFYDEERAGTQPARHTFYDADRADEAKNEVKAHKIASYHNAFRWHTAWMTQSVPARSLMVKIVAEVKCAA